MPNLTPPRHISTLSNAAGQEGDLAPIINSALMTRYWRH